MPETRTVGILSPFVGGDYYGAIIAGINQAATTAGDRIIALQTLDPGAHSADLSGVPDFRRRIAWQHLDGFVVLPGAVDAGYVRSLQLAGKAVVLVSHDLPGIRCPSVAVDNRFGVRESVAHLVAHGHERIAFAGNLTVGDVRERYEGYREALAAQGFRIRPELLFSAPDNHETGGVAVADQLIGAHLPATAVVMGTDRNAIGLIHQMTAAGYKLPDELAVVGFDDIADTWYAVPSLSSVRQPLDLLGGGAYELLLEVVGGASGPAGPRLVSTAFVGRDSCGCPRGGLRLSEAQARAQFNDNAYLQMTLNIQYELGIDLLRTHERDPRALAWLGRTPAQGGCLGLWMPDGAPATVGDGDTSTDPPVELVGAFSIGEDLPVAIGSVVPVSTFPPAGLFALANGAVGDIVFVVPVRSTAQDWGVLAAVGRIQDTTPPGREMMNHSGALLAVALDHDAMLRAQLEQEERLRRAALYDQLTGLPNRTLFFDRLHQAERRAERQPEHRFAVLFLDLDGFKSVNDTLGHAAGDSMLIHVARCLDTVLRKSDTAARLGGDEFVVLLDGVSAPDGEQQAVERIHAALADPLVIDGRLVRVATSIGVAASADGYIDADDLLRIADAAMYEAKTRRKIPHP